MELDLYSKIEPLLGFEKEILKLYAIFLTSITKALPNKGRILDVGCGGGAFCKLLMDNGFEVVGIDLSPAMVERSKKLGVDAYAKALEELGMGKFDAITAVFDVLNYLGKIELDEFLLNVQNRLNDNGYFFADINSYYGFSEVAQGILSVENSDATAIVDAEFDGDKLTTNLTLFSRQENELYKKERGLITQYYHEVESLKNVDGLELIKKQGVRLFGDKADKEFLTFKNATKL